MQLTVVVEQANVKVEELKRTITTGSTRRESLAEARKRIELGRGRVLGVVLNKRRYPVARFLCRRS